MKSCRASVSSIRSGAVTRIANKMATTTTASSPRRTLSTEGARGSGRCEGGLTRRRVGRSQFRRKSAAIAAYAAEVRWSGMGGRAPALARSIIGADNVLLSGPCTELSRGGFRLRYADACASTASRRRGSRHDQAKSIPRSTRGRRSLPALIGLQSRLRRVPPRSPKLPSRTHPMHSGMLGLLLRRAGVRDVTGKAQPYAARQRW
jgi:hypothetical protein